MMSHDLPLMPTEGAPAATACRAYSIWTSLPEGLRKGGRECRQEGVEEKGGSEGGGKEFVWVMSLFT